MAENKRIALIGAGPAGIMFLAAFAQLQKEGVKVPEIVTYERQDKVGGQWNFNWRTGLAQDGLPVHGSMYNNLWSNAPKEVFELPDYPLEEYFGVPTSSYPPRPAVRDYLDGYIAKLGISLDKVRFNTSTTNVVYLQDKKKFHVTASNEAGLTTEEYDHVVVASGHFSTPNVPEFKGFQEFTGTIIHSHDYRDATAYQGRNVLVIGASYSAEDIASQVYKYGAKSVVISHRNKDKSGNWANLGYTWPEQIVEKPLLRELKDNRAIYEDGSSTPVECVILCTGYQHKYPFLAPELRLNTKNLFWIESLRKGVALDTNPNIFFVGMHNEAFTFPMFLGQGRLIRNVIMGKTDLEAPLMDEDGKAWQDADFKNFFDNIKEKAEAVQFQSKYVETLWNTTGYKIVSPKGYTDHAFKLFGAWIVSKQKDIMGFRTLGHPSYLTGHQSPNIHESKSWLKSQVGCTTEWYRHLHEAS